jgi:hypothetical protein
MLIFEKSELVELTVHATVIRDKSVVAPDVFFQHRALETGCASSEPIGAPGIYKKHFKSAHSCFIVFKFWEHE